MSPAKHLNDDELTLVYFSEAPAPQARHARECAECSARLGRLTRILDAIRVAPAPDAGTHFEQRLWAALAPEVSRVMRPKRGWLPVWIGAPALAALLVAAFFVGRLAPREPVSGRPQVRASVSDVSRTRERVLLISLGRHLERAEMLLTEIDLSPDARTDIGLERQIATSLVTENRLLHQTALETGDGGDAQLLDELGRLLVDVAHAPDQVSARELADWRQEIRREGLLFKVKVTRVDATAKGMKL